MDPFIPNILPLKQINWQVLVPQVGSANRALAYFNGILGTIPNQNVLLSPLTTKEAVLSSRIEGTQATLGEVFNFEAGEEPKQEQRRQDIFEILNYRAALREAQGELKTRPFNLNLLLRLHEILLDSVRGRDKGRGSFRTSQNWIGKPRCPIEKADFVPPAPADVARLLDNWEKYYHADEMDPLVQLAIVHAQFVIIHPFLDGNGRLGRILIPLFLYEKDLLSAPTFYLSSWLEEHRDEYIDLLRALDGSAECWERWIHFFLVAVQMQAKTFSDTAQRITELYGGLKTEVLKITHSQFAIPLLDQMFQRPIFNSRSLRFSEVQPSKPAVQHLLRALVKAKILKVMAPAAGRRPARFCFPSLLNICEGRNTF